MTHFNSVLIGHCLVTLIQSLFLEIRILEHANIQLFYMSIYIILHY